MWPYNKTLLFFINIKRRDIAIVFPMKAIARATRRAAGWKLCAKRSRNTSRLLTRRARNRQYAIHCRRHTCSCCNRMQRLHARRPSNGAPAAANSTMLTFAKTAKVPQRSSRSHCQRPWNRHSYWRRSFAKVRRPKNAEDWKVRWPEIKTQNACCSAFACAYRPYWRRVPSFAVKAAAKRCAHSFRVNKSCENGGGKSNDRIKFHGTMKQKMCVLKATINATAWWVVLVVCNV